MDRGTATLTVTLDRAGRRNAFTPGMIDDILSALERADGDDDVRTVVVTGRGPHFSVGADVASRSSDGEPVRGGTPTAGRGAELALRLLRMDKPVIGVVRGDAVGLGATVLLPMDVRLAAESARFGFVFTRRGLVPEACSTWFLPRLVGIGRAVDWCTTGRLVGAEEALAAGLVHEVVPDHQLDERAAQIAAEIAERTAPVAVALTRRLLWAMLQEPDPAVAGEIEAALVDRLRTSPDAREGFASFLDKRPPDFPLRTSRDLPHDIWPAAGAPPRPAPDAAGAT